MKKYLSLIKKMTKSIEFNKLYDAFNNIKSNENYNFLANYLTFTIENIKYRSFSYNKDKTKIEINTNKFILYDDTGKIIYNTLFLFLWTNTYKNYKNNLIFNNSYGNNKIYKINNTNNKKLIGEIYSQYIINNISISGEKKWKQVLYYQSEGETLTYDIMNNFIENAHKSYTTHIILGFILLTLSIDGTSDRLIPSETMMGWIALSNVDKKKLLQKMKDYNIILVAGFGGNNSFENGFQYVLKSSNYFNPKTLATDLITIMEKNYIYDIDLDIKYIPNFPTYPNTDDIVDYLGLLSKNIKEIILDKYNLNCIVIHAPQSIHFCQRDKLKPYVDGFGHVYNSFEQFYGSYCDFYNIQYYNQLRYNYYSYDSMFIKDNSFSAAILQIINANEISKEYFPIPIHKIICGKATASIIGIFNGNPPEYMGYVPFTENTENTMVNYIKKTRKSNNKQLKLWSKIGGIAVWSNFINYQVENENIFKYFKKIGN